MLKRRAVCGLALLLAMSSVWPAVPDAVRSAATALAQRIEHGEHAGIVGFAMSVDGETIAEAGQDALLRDPTDLRSATKSITALLVGIALDRGELAGLDQPVAGLLPEYRRWLDNDERKLRITLTDLLTMRSGLDCDDWNPASPGHEDRMYRKPDWLAFWARQPMRDEPGTRFSYCTGNVIALGRILRQVAGMPLDAYARIHLFEPLGIGEAAWAHWKRGSEIDSGGHLRLSPRSLLRIGELVLGRGEYRGKRIVSATWIERMTHEHTAIPDRPQRYGYLWWLDATTRAELPRTRLQMAWGNGGNFLIVMPEQNAVVAFVGTRYNRPDAQEPLLWLRDELLTAFVAAPAAVPD